MKPRRAFFAIRALTPLATKSAGPIKPRPFVLMLQICSATSNGSATKHELGAWLNASLVLFGSPLNLFVRSWT